MAGKRAGRTVKVRVSLDVDDLAVLERRARRRLVDMLGGPVLTPDTTAVIDAEQAADPKPARRKASRRKSAA